jgi:hypothetical protein
LRSGSIRADCFVSAEGQQHYPAGVPRSPRYQGKKDLGKTWEQAAREWWFETTLPGKLDKAEADWHATQPTDPLPVIVHHEIDEQLQTGDSRLLGGAMSIHAPWSDGNQQDPS